MDKKYLVLYSTMFCATIIKAQVDSTKSDSLLLLEIQQQLEQTSTAPPAAQAPASANPSISVIGDFQGLYRSYGDHHYDAVLNEVEFSFESAIDPYAKANFYYSIGEDAATGEFTSEIEEGYLTTLSLPAHLQLKAGRFKQNVGRVNPVHSHALPFIDLPDPYVNYFGDEGLKGDGLSLSWLIPNHSFYQELTFEGTSVSENPSFTRNRMLFLGHLKNFWDLSDNATVELGLTGMNGENDFGKSTNLYSIDLTYKWKPVQFNTYKSLVFQNEIYFSNANLDSVRVNTKGFYSMLSYQLSKRLFLVGRYDYSNAPYAKTYVQQSGDLTLGWYATEFQKIEVSGKYTTVNEPVEEFNHEENFFQGYLRWIFIIGSHGAHQY